MANDTDNTTTAPALTAAAGYARECQEWQEKQMILRQESASNIEQHLIVNRDMSIEERKFHEKQMAFEIEWSKRHQRWANGIREILSHTNEEADASRKP